MGKVIVPCVQQIARVANRSITPKPLIHQVQVTMPPIPEFIVIQILSVQCVHGLGLGVIDWRWLIVKIAAAPEPVSACLSVSSYGSTQFQCLINALSEYNV